MSDLPRPDRADDAGDDALLLALRRHADLGLDPAAQRTVEDALDRFDPAAPRSRRRRLSAWVGSHLAASAAIGALAVGGTATAAVATFTGTPSSPTRGEIPRGPGEHRVRDLTYRVWVTPSLKVGEVGWCSGSEFRYTGAAHPLGGRGCGPAVRGEHETAGGGSTFLGRGRGMFVWQVVDRRVAYGLLSDGERVVPADDPGLPNGWRAIVLLPGRAHDDRIRLRDAQHRPIETGHARPDFVPEQPIAKSTSLPPADAGCAVTAVPRGASPRASRWLVDSPEAADGLRSRAYLPCTQTAMRAEGRWAELVVLLDAGRPGEAEPAPIAASAPMPGRQDTVEFPASPAWYWLERTCRGLPERECARRRLPETVASGSTAAARRQGRAWVVALAPTRALRRRLLDEAKVRVPVG